MWLPPTDANCMPPGFHQVVRLLSEDIHLRCGTQGVVAHAALNLIDIAQFSRLGDIADDEKMVYSAADTGFVSQNMYLFGAALGLRTVVRS